MLVTEAPSDVVQILAPLEMVRCVLAPLEMQKESAQAWCHAWTAVACWQVWSKMRANCWIAWSWASLIWVKGAGMGLESASVREQAALTAALAEELWGTGQSWGGNQQF